MGLNDNNGSVKSSLYYHSKLNYLPKFLIKIITINTTKIEFNNKFLILESFY